MSFIIIQLVNLNPSSLKTYNNSTSLNPDIPTTYLLCNFPNITSGSFTLPQKHTHTHTHSTWFLNFIYLFIYILFIFFGTNGLNVEVCLMGWVPSFDPWSVCHHEEGMSNKSFVVQFSTQVFPQTQFTFTDEYTIHELGWGFYELKRLWIEFIKSQNTQWLLLTLPYYTFNAKYFIYLLLLRFLIKYMKNIVKFFIFILVVVNKYHWNIA